MNNGLRLLFAILTLVFFILLVILLTVVLLYTCLLVASLFNRRLQLLVDQALTYLRAGRTTESSTNNTMLHCRSIEPSNTSTVLRCGGLRYTELITFISKLIRVVRLVYFSVCHEKLRTYNRYILVVFFNDRRLICNSLWLVSIFVCSLIGEEHSDRHLADLEMHKENVLDLLLLIVVLAVRGVADSR